MSDIRITNCEFSHTAMTGLFVSHVSNLVADRNVFTDIGNWVTYSRRICTRHSKRIYKVKIEKPYSPGYHGLLTLGGPEYENITITNNYFDGTGITRYWETNALKHVGSRHV